MSELPYTVGRSRVGGNQEVSFESIQFDISIRLEAVAYESKTQRRSQSWRCKFGMHQHRDGV